MKTPLLMKCVQQTICSRFASLATTSCAHHQQQQNSLPTTMSNSSLNLSGLNLSLKSCSLSTTTKKPEQPSKLTEQLMSIRKAKPTNPYLIFINKNFKNMLEQHPDLPNKEVMKKAGTVWRAMSIEQKFAFFGEADKNRKERKENITEFKESLSPASVKELDADFSRIQSERRAYLAKLRIRSEKKKLQCPRKPPGPYCLYAASLDRGDAPVTEFTKGASRKWHALPEQDKDQYREENAQAVAKYQSELKEWEQRMLADGRDELVRESTKKAIAKLLNKKQIDLGQMQLAKLKKANKKLSDVAKRHMQTVKSIKSDLKQQEQHKSHHFTSSDL